jgi:hypothetical protein
MEIFLNVSCPAVLKMAVCKPVCYILSRIGLEEFGYWSLFVVIKLGNKINLHLLQLQ